MKRHIALALIVILTTGCAAAGNMLKWDQLTPERKVLWMMRLYNGAVDDYRYLVAKGAALSEEERRILIVKKRIMREVYPLIGMYYKYVREGKVPDKELENHILSLLERLVPGGR